MEILNLKGYHRADCDEILALSGVAPIFFSLVVDFLTDVNSLKVPPLQKIGALKICAGGYLCAKKDVITLSLPNPTLKPDLRSPTEAELADIEAARQRRHVRVFYPEICPKKFLPELILNYRAYPVLDISEGGVRFATPNAALIKDGPINAALHFPDGGVVEISGMVVRRIRNQVALMLEKGIPYCRIMSEQLRLKNLENNGLISFTTK